MKNKEKYAKEIMDIACSGNSIAITKEGRRIAPCCDTFCVECLFCGGNCKEKVREWTEQEYIEKPVISKRDKVFLDYLKEYKCVARDCDGKLYAYTFIPKKILGCASWGVDGDSKNISKLSIDFPMVKWEDEEPWFIEDLKKLDVVEEYEHEELKRNLQKHIDIYEKLY